MTEPPLDEPAWGRIGLAALVAAAVAAGIAAGAASLRAPVHRASIRLLVAPDPGEIPSERILSRVLEGLNDRGPAATLAEVATAGRLWTEATGAEDGAGEYRLRATPLSRAHVVELTVEGPAPERAAELAARMAESAAAFFGDRYPVWRAELLDPSPATFRARPRTGWEASLAAVLGGLLGAVVAAWRGRRGPIARPSLPAPGNDEAASG